MAHISSSPWTSWDPIAAQSASPAVAGDPYAVPHLWVSQQLWGSNNEGEGGPAVGEADGLADRLARWRAE